MVEEKEKPTVEEMIEAYRQYCERVDEALKKAGGVRVDFSKQPSPYWRTVRLSRLRSLLLSAAMLLLMFILSTPYASAMNYQTDITPQVAAVEAMLNNAGGI